MDKIVFKNLPDKTTSITAEKLNAVQDNAEKAINEKLNIADKATSDEVIDGTDDTKYTTPVTVKSAINKTLGDIETLLAEV